MRGCIDSAMVSCTVPGSDHMRWGSGSPKHGPSLETLPCHDNMTSDHVWGQRLATRQRLEHSGFGKALKLTDGGMT